VLILIWYAKNIHLARRGKTPGVDYKGIFFVSSAFDLYYYEALLLRLSQLIFSILGCF
jgi:hypothetical protein